MKTLAKHNELGQQVSYQTVCRCKLRTQTLYESEMLAVLLYCQHLNHLLIAFNNRDEKAGAWEMYEDK